MLVRASRVAGAISKEAASVPGIPGLAGEGGAHLLTATPEDSGTKPAGTEGRLKNLAAPRAKLKEFQSSRAYAPRIGPPSP